MLSFSAVENFGPAFQSIEMPVFFFWRQASTDFDPKIFVTKDVVSVFSVKQSSHDLFVCFGEGSGWLTCKKIRFPLEALMKTTIPSLFRPLDLLAVLTVALLAFVAITFAQTRIVTPRTSTSGFGTSGQWTADVKNAAGDEIQFEIKSVSDNGRNEYSSGRTMKISDFQGLNIADATAAAKTSVSFSLVREAGTINFEGTFSHGLGAGTWRFAPNASFASAMQSRGFTVTDSDLVRAAFINLSTKYADEIRSAGFEKLSFDDLARAWNHKITVAYINELRSMGFAGVTMSDVIRANNHEIDANFAADMKAAGFSSLSLDDLVRLKNHEISSSYVSELKGEGISNISADDVIRAKNHDITADVIRRAKAQGYTNAGLEELIRLNNRGLIK
jgi:hypothetical protein